MLEKVLAYLKAGKEVRVEDERYFDIVLDPIVELYPAEAFEEGIDVRYYATTFPNCEFVGVILIKDDKVVFDPCVTTDGSSLEYAVEFVEEL